MYLYLKDLMLMENYCGMYDSYFAETFGNKMEWNAKNIEKFMGKDKSFIDVFNFIIENLNEGDLKSVARYLKVEFCKRCFDIGEIQDDVVCTIVGLSRKRQACAILELFPFIVKMRTSYYDNKIKYLTLADVVLNFNDEDISLDFAKTFGDRCPLTKKNLEKLFIDIGVMDLYYLTDVVCIVNNNIELDDTSNKDYLINVLFEFLKKELK